MKNLKDTITESFVSEAKITNITDNDMFADQLGEFIWSSSNAEYKKIRKALDNDTKLNSFGFIVLWEREYLNLTLACDHAVDKHGELIFKYDYDKHDYFCQTMSQLKYGPLTIATINFLVRQVKRFIKAIPGDTLYLPESFVITIDEDGEAEYR